MAKIERNPRSEDTLDFSDDNRGTTIGTKNDVKKRVPLGSNRNVLKLQFEDDPNWHYCVVNESNMHQYKAAGYVFVMADGSSIDDYDNVSLESVWRLQTGYDRNVGRPLYSYAMKIPMELYKADRLELKKERMEALKAIKGDYLKKDDTYGDVRIEED